MIATTLQLRDINSIVPVDDVFATPTQPGKRIFGNYPEKPDWYGFDV